MDFQVTRKMSTNIKNNQSDFINTPRNKSITSLISPETLQLRTDFMNSKRERDFMNLFLKDYDNLLVTFDNIQNIDKVVSLLSNKPINSKETKFFMETNEKYKDVIKTRA